ncbi:3-carboxymuconate cyclase [Decorospora gaudefroyi]|uniref:3-carboxymuconate cyclase n=1 Tax=Decorospora gaudefroyi TaxID=184978 RepID=A0A6A5KU98_9PLEO|nr:3-carboxymuconate cyclase [Decorospora gaudefroyi]
MRSLPLLVTLGTFGLTTAKQLLVASYGNGTSAGAIQTLELLSGSDEGSNPKLKVVHENHDCRLSPTWLDVSLDGDSVTCLDESAPIANITTLSIEPNGSLKKISAISVLGGPVSMTTYNNRSAMALAHYGPLPAISLFTIKADNSFGSLPNLTFQAPEQIHQAVTDPTGQYMVFPSLGADLVHVFCIDPASGLLAKHVPLQCKKGYGPRHAVFWSSGELQKIYLFVVHENSNKIVGYEVGYLEHGGLTFSEVVEVSTYGDHPAPPMTFASELAISPDGKFLIAANRNGSVFEIDHPDPRNSTNLSSDSLVTFRLLPNGNLLFVQLAKSGGIYPRHFSMNKDGSLIAVANQKTKNVNVYSRNLETGAITDDKAIASAEKLGPGDLM